MVMDKVDQMAEKNVGFWLIGFSISHLFLEYFTLEGAPSKGFCFSRSHFAGIPVNTKEIVAWTASNLP